MADHDSAGSDDKNIREVVYLMNMYNLLSKVAQPGVLPPEYDTAFYRMVQVDLSAIMDAQQLWDHYVAFGKQEGRIASSAAHRAGFLAAIPADIRLLEIGPFTSPVFRGPNVKYFDVLDREKLVERALAHHIDPSNCVDIDFVSPTGDLSIVGETFDAILSSHCIEHQPDLIRHLMHVERLLKPGGAYYIIVPDKRYCFDHFIDVSEVAEVEQAFAEKRIVHTFKSVHEHVALTTHNNTLLHWRGDHIDPNADTPEVRAAVALEHYTNAAGGYFDVHAWQFTPESFRSVIATVIASHDMQLRVERVYETVYSRNEFTAVIRRL